MKLSLTRYNELLRKYVSDKDMTVPELIEIANISLSIGVVSTGIYMKKTCEDNELRVSELTELFEELLNSLFTASGISVSSEVEAQTEFVAVPLYDKAGNC